MQICVATSAQKLRAMLESAGAAFSISHHRPGDLIFRQGDESLTVMHIEEGRVKLSVSSSEGKSAICGLLGPGSFLGEDVLGGWAFRRETATAIVATELVVISRATMMALLQDNQTIAQRLLAYTLVRESALETELTVQLLCSSEERVIHALFQLAGCHSRCRGRCDLPKVSQETIAEMVGATRSRVNLFMSNFKRIGFLEKHGGLLQINPSRLNAIRMRPERAFPQGEEVQRTAQETHVQPHPETQHAEGSIEQAEDAEHDRPVARKPRLQQHRHASQDRQRRTGNQPRRSDERVHEHRLGFSAHAVE